MLINKSINYLFYLLIGENLSIDDNYKVENKMLKKKMERYFYMDITSLGIFLNGGQGLLKITFA